MPPALQTLNAQAREWLLHYEARGARHEARPAAEREAKCEARREAAREAKSGAKREAEREARRQARRAAKSRAEHGAKHEAEREAAHEAKHEAASAFTFPCLALYFRFMFTLYTSALNFILFFHFYMSDSYFYFRFMI